MVFTDIVVHNKGPITERAKSRNVVGPYHFTPRDPLKHDSIGFYCDRSGQMGDGVIRLRIEPANDHLTGRLSYTTGYYCDRDGDGDTLQPIIARLPHGRGFLAGWSMGPGMCAKVCTSVYDDVESAAISAHSIAEYDAEESRNNEEYGDDDDLQSILASWL